MFYLEEEKNEQYLDVHRYIFKKRTHRPFKSNVGFFENWKVYGPTDTTKQTDGKWIYVCVVCLYLDLYNL